jgi:Glycosyl hydrolase family 99
MGILAMALLAGCGGDSGAPPPVVADAAAPMADAPPPLPPPATVYAPVAVAKTFTKKVYVHMMPWFETPATSTNNRWGIHWTMANRDPRIVDANGKRQIASYFYPLIGPYGSSDKDVIEYQLLEMKYAGVDGILIDWPGTLPNVDYPKNRANSEAIIALTEKVGLEFAVVYEDQNITRAGVADKVAAGKADLTYLQNNYFSKPNYIKINNAPLLMVFGPQTFQTPAEWTSIFSGLAKKPTFVTLWYQSGEAGTNAQGEFAWFASDHLTGLQRFYDDTRPLAVKVGVVYPGFDSFYADGGWGGERHTIPVGTATYGQTWTLTKNSGVDWLQVATWNDYGEGTMIEPTVELGYSILTAMQTNLGVGYGQSELELIDTLYRRRKQHAGDVGVQRQLDQAFYYLVALQVAKARELLAALP